MFSVTSWADANEGEKIVIWAKSGDGKTTLASMAPNPIFVGIDDGSRKILNPKTGKHVNKVNGVDTFTDLRDVLHQVDLFPAGSTVVIDTVTKMESFLEPYIFANYKVKDGAAKNMRAYGWDGPAHLLDCFRLFLSDLDGLVRRGVNIILLAQLADVTIANAEGIDYLEAGPKLQHNKQYSVRSEVCEWADHVFKVGYLNFDVQLENDKAKVGKVQSNDTTHAIYTQGARHFLAKSRPIKGVRLPPVVSFATPEDDSLWQIMFEGATVQ